MNRWQVALLVALIGIPIAIYGAIGGWALWQTGWLPYVAWVLPVFWTIAYLLVTKWKAAWQGPPPDDAPLHWTARDEAAWQLVLDRSKKLEDVDPERLLDPHFYLSTAQELGLEISRRYHPDAADPLGPLTVPELLAAAELALNDTAQWVRQYVPGSHLLRVDHWRMLAQAPKWAKTVSRAWWISSVLIDPTTLLRKLVSKLAVDSTTRELQAGVLAAFHAKFVERIGYYLIELNSGRLRLGAEHYREAQRRFGPDAARQRRDDSRDEHPQERTPPPASEPAKATGANSAPSAAVEVAIVEIPADKSSASAAPFANSSISASNGGATDDASDGRLVVCLAGQVKAGKSSVVNLLTGTRQAETDILPCTTGVKRYHFTLPGAAEFTLLDTAGYAEDGVPEKELAEVERAVTGADLLLVVMNAGSPARSADVQLLEKLTERIEAQAHLKLPPTIGVLTHIDSLRPAMEWRPPYDWRAPKSTKERSIHDAVEFNRELFGERFTEVVPICSDASRNRVWGVDEFLLPALVRQLPKSRACALLRALHTDWDDQRVTLVWEQLKSAGTALSRAVKELLRPGDSR